MGSLYYYYYFQLIMGFFPTNYYQIIIEFLYYYQIIIRCLYYYYNCFQTMMYFLYYHYHCATETIFYTITICILPERKWVQFFYNQTTILDDLHKFIALQIQNDNYYIESLYYDLNATQRRHIELVEFGLGRDHIIKVYRRNQVLLKINCIQYTYYDF